VYFYAATASQITQCLLAENNKSGAFLMASTGNRITHCICSNNGIEGGINFYGSTGNVVSLNNLTGNAVGINPSHSNNNNISSNNFIGNTRDVVFKAISKANTKQHWQGNYWEVPRRFPKLIIGTFFIAGIIKIPFINVDWHPAQAPYNIT
jgi:parallel beta-helix repeat protein